MANDYDDIIQELRDAGVSDDYVNRVQGAFAASPIRKERDEAKAEAQKYRAAALHGAFKEAGVKVNPSVLAIPADLDPLDTDKVRAWAVEAGLAEPAPPAVPAEEQQAHQQLANASAGAAPPPPNDARAEVLAAESASDFWAKANAAGLSTNE